MLVARLEQSDLGFHHGIPCDATKDEVELVFRCDCRLETTVRDGDTPLSGALCGILDSYGAMANTVYTDEAGRAGHGSLGPGRYNVRVVRKDCWPVERVVEVHDGANQVVLTMRRTGALELSVTSNEGLAVPGQVVGVWSAEFDADVAHWIEQRRVRADSGLVTDQNGKVLVDGLPHGSYRWTVSLAGGAGLAGQVEVPVGETGQQRIVLP